MSFHHSVNIEIEVDVLATRGSRQESNPPQGDGNATAAGHSEKGRRGKSQSYGGRTEDEGRS